MAAALAVALLSMNAHAQQALETVVVSANKRVEKLESVPMAISVMSEQEIQRTNIREIEDVVAMMPSLTLNSAPPRPTTPSSCAVSAPYRSVSAWSRTWRSSSTTFRSPPSSRFKDLADVSRIEVLKGPQSTLFGKSAVAGAVNIVTKPISGPMVYRASTYLTNDNEWRVNASAGGQLDEHFACACTPARPHAGQLPQPDRWQGRQRLGRQDLHGQAAVESDRQRAG
jgi:iron complex outermembrane receptor protein